MKILHITYARVNRSDPHAWLEYLNFFTGILDEMAKFHIVESIHLINYTGMVRKKNVLYHFLKVSRWGWILPFRLSKRISNCKPDVIIVHGLVFPWHLLWLRVHLKREVKLLLQHHAEPPLRFPKSVLQRIIDRRVSAYFFTSADLGTPWLKKGQIRDQSRIHEVIELSSPFYTSAKESRRPHPKTYLWIGRFDDNKDPITLIDAFIEFLSYESEAVLHVIFRGGHLISEIQGRLRASKVSRQIVLEGSVDHQEIEHWYDKSSFIISTSHYEGSGAAVCEGMSCGCIPILTDIPSFRTITGNGKLGLLFRPGDVDDLARTLIRSTSINLSEERRKVFEQFRGTLSFEAISKKMLEVIGG